MLFYFQESQTNNIKVLAKKNLASYILKTKAIFVNPDEHEY